MAGASPDRAAARRSLAPPERADVVVVGAGIVGLATARALAAPAPGRSVVVLEREDRIAAHQTSHNSGVVHAGVYYAPGSLKARLCVEGARRLYEYCAEHGVPVRRSGKVIVATSAEELPRLEEIHARGLANAVPGLRMIGPEELSELEPAARGIAALHSPATGVVDFPRVAEALARDVEEGGGAVATACAVSGLRRVSGGTAVAHARGSTLARAVVTCAGAWSDQISAAAGAAEDPRIVPFRGAYLALPESAAPLVRSMIYPVPDPALPFLGVHLTRHIDDTVTAGPSALLVGGRTAYRLRDARPGEVVAALRWPGTVRMLRRHWRSGAAELRLAASRRAFAAAAARYVPELATADLRPAFAGIRAQAVARDGRLVDDFVVSATPGAVHVRNAPSPAATSSLAIAELIADRAEALLA